MTARRRCPRLDLEVLEDRALLSIFTVDRLTDTGQGSGLAGDLRYCITKATSGQDIVNFSVIGTINLTQALPNLTSSVSIDGPGSNLLTVRRDTGGGYRIFTVANGVTVQISGLTIANGTSMIFGGGIDNDGTLTVSDSTISGNSANVGGGGGIYNSASGALTVNNSNLADNKVSDPDGIGGGILNDGALTISSNSTLSGNHAAAGAAIYNDFSGTLNLGDSTISSNSGANDGGGIYNGGTLSVSNSTISGNTAIDNGGGIVSLGTLTVSNSTLSGNSISDAFGSALCIFSGSLRVTNSTISGNKAKMGYGAIYIRSAPATISNSTISANSSLYQGGAIVNSGTLTVSGSTISGNSAPGSLFPPSSAAGGIANSGTLTVSDSTISGNSGSGSQAAGGIANYAAANSDATVMLLSCTISSNTVSGNDRTASQLYSGQQGTGTGNASVTFRNTIVSGDGTKANFFADAGGIFVSQGHNLTSDNGGGFLTGPGDLTNANPLLGPLQDNGGPTPTMALLPGSPAVDAGDNTGAPDFDQRGPGFPRIVGGTIDIGAFEVQPGPASHFQVSAPAQVTSNAPFDITVTALDAYGHTAVGYLGTVSFTSSDTNPGVVVPPNYPFMVDDSGAHLFTRGVTLRTPGSQTITATDTLVSSITGSASVLVTSPLLLVTTTLDSGPGSLRQAILDADAIPGPNMIRFAIGTGIQTISVVAPLPAITQQVVIDGTTQPGYTGVPLIELNGAAAGPGADGLLITAGGTIVRGLVINRFALYGIELQNSGGNGIQGNYLGTDVTGTMPLGNGIGLRVATSNNTIGGTAAGAGNVISGNLGDGIFISDNSTGNLVQGNSIGTDASGTINVANANNGVHLLNASGNTIGGTMDGAANIIAFNGNDGVLVDTGSSNGIRHNSIYAHTSGLGIELVSGGNSRLSFPVLTMATSDGATTTVAGLLQSAPSLDLTLEFFANPTCNPSGFGEGEQFLGTSIVTTNSHGTASFAVTFAVAVPSGQFIAATATDPNNNTSAFSNCVSVAGPAAPPALVLGPHDPGSDLPITFGLTIPMRGFSSLNLVAATGWTGDTLESGYQPLRRGTSDVLFERWRRMQGGAADTVFTSFPEEMLSSVLTGGIMPR